MTDLNSIFGTSKKYVSPSEAEKGNPNEYKVSYKTGKDGVYTSLIRFVVNPRDPSNSIISKDVTWLKDPITGKSRPVDNPRTLGSDAYNPIDKMFWYYFNTKDAAKIDAVKNLIRTSTQHAAIIQIIEDKQHPELKGKFKIFRYGKKIQDMIDTENTGNNYMQGRDPFSPFTGRYFMLQCCNQGGNNNYDKSQFIDAPNSVSGILYETGQRDANGNSLFFNATPDTQNIQQFLYNYMIENTPKLEEYAYKQWDSSVEDFVTQTLQNIANFIDGGTTHNIFPQNNTVMESIKNSGATPTNVSDMMAAQNITQPTFETPAPTPQIPATINAAQAPVPEFNSMDDINTDAPNSFGEMPDTFF